MGNCIPSEAQAEQIGVRLTAGERDAHFTVFRYIDRRTRLTLFGVEIRQTGRLVLFD